MQTELEKRIESYISELGMKHDRNNNPDIIHPPSMRLMAKFILEMPELREVVEALSSLRREDIVGADGTRVRCTCGRERCIDFRCSAGDRIYTSSYASKFYPEEILEKLRELGVV